MLKYAEKKISLVGWGEWQIMLHTVNNHTGISVVENNRITKFGLAPWLKGLIAVVPPRPATATGTNRWANVPQWCCRCARAPSRTE
jgi:hypothetical protein